MSKFSSRKHSDNAPLSNKGSRTPQNKEKENRFKYPEILKTKNPQKPLQVSTNQTDLRSPSTMSSQSPLNSKFFTTHRSQSMFQDAQYVDFIITNKEVGQFMKKHFIHDNSQSSRAGSKIICESWDKVPVAYFIKSLFLEYPEIIEDHQLNDNMQSKLKSHIKDLVSEDGNILSLNKLQIHTKQLGLIGLLLTTLRDIQEQKLVTPVKQKEVEKVKPNQKDVFQQRFQEMIDNLESHVNERINTQMKRLTQKQREVERIFQIVNAKVTDNFDLFQHEAKTKQIISQLKQQIKDKDKIIKELESKLLEKQKVVESRRSMNSSLDEDCLKFQKASPVPQNTIQLSPFNNEMTQLQKIYSDIMQAWESTCVQEDYRFAQILISQESNQLPFQQFQMLPIIKNMPGFQELIVRGQSCCNILTFWIQKADQNTIIDLFNQFIQFMPSIKLVDSESYLIQQMNMFLKLSTTILIIKSIFNSFKLKEWIAQKKIKEENILNIVNSIIQIQQFSIKQIPQSKQWNQINTIQETGEQSKLIEHPIVNNTIKKIFQMLSQSKNQKLQNIIRILQCLYSNDPDDCILILQSVQAEKDIDIQLSRLILDCDLINPIIFPHLHNPKYTLKLLQCLLSFRCPGQFYLTYTKQVCQKNNIDILVELLTKFHNTPQNEIQIKIWEIVGAIAKTVCLKDCKDSLQFVIRMYLNCQVHNIIQNIHHVQKNLQ
ncbi:hypothetical protein pb186bvf_019029 [Paramecium bursaria]